MKALHKLQVLSVAAVGSFGLLMSTGCDVTPLQDAADDFGVVIGLEPIETAPTVMITDANSGELIEAEVTVTYGGPNADDVIDIYSDPVTSETITGGIFNFGLDNAVTPSEDAPVRVQLNLQANGYVSRSQTLTVTTGGQSEFLISMVNAKNPPLSVNTVSNQNGNSNANGAIADTIAIASNYSQNPDEGGVEVTIPSGTVLTDADGTPLTGRLRTEVTTYDPSSPEALKSLPMDLDGEDEGLVLLGFSTLQITDENGRIAVGSQTNEQGNSVQFISQAQMRFYLSPAINEVDRYDGWIGRDNEPPVMISDLGVEEDNRKRRYVSFDNANFPSNADGSVGVIQKPSQVDATVTLNRNGHTGPLKVTVSGTGFSKDYIIPAGEGSSTLTKTVPDLTYSINIENGLHTTPSWKFSTQGILTIDLPAPPSNLIDATVNVALSCRFPPEKVRVTGIPGSSVSYRKADAPQGTLWKQATNLTWNYDKSNQVLSGGSFNVSSVENGAVYRFKISYDGKQHEEDVQINGTNFTYRKTIDDDICSY